MAQRFRNWTALVSRFGWRAAIETFVLWMGRQTFGYRKALVYRLDLNRIPMPRERDQFEWAFMDPSEIEDALIPGLPPAETPHAAEQRYFVGSLKGAQCYSSVLSTRGFTVPDRMRVSFLGTTEAYVGDCLTLPEHRGKGVYPCGLVQLALRLHAEGKTALYLFVERDNLASIRSVRKAGFDAIAICSVWYFWHRARRRWRFVGDAGVSRPNWAIDVASAQPVARATPGPGK